MRASIMVLAFLISVAIVTLDSGLAVPVQAQELMPGTRIRITTGDTGTVGHLERSTPDSLLLFLPDGGRVAFSWADAERVEMSMGWHSRARRGALIGAGLMTAFSVAFVVGGYDIEVLFPMLPMNAAIGAGLGALMGRTWRSERWMVIPVGTASAARGFSPGLTVIARF